MSVDPAVWTATRHGGVCVCNTDIRPGEACVWQWPHGQMHATCTGVSR